MLQILSLFLWHRKHRHEVLGVKFSYGLNGNILRCSDLQSQLEVVYQQCFRPSSPPAVVDWTLGDFWSRWNFPSDANNESGNKGDVMNIYKFNLLWHIGSVSAIGNKGSRQDAFRKSQQRCFEVMSHFSLYMKERFDIWGSDGFLLSPCDRSNQSSDASRLVNSNATSFLTGVEELESPLSREALIRVEEFLNQPQEWNQVSLAVGNKLRHELKKFLRVSTHFGEGESCDYICKADRKSCLLEAFPIVNQCAELRLIDNNCQCQRAISITDELLAAPLLRDGICYLKSSFPFSCVQKPPDPKDKRVCPCVDTL